MNDFLWVGNRAALDFINTAIVADGEPVELLCEASDVAQWLVEAGLLEGERAGRRLPGGLLAEARQYRGRLREGVGMLAAGKLMPSGLLEQTNAYLGGDSSRPRLAREAEGYRIKRERRLVAAADFLAPVAESFADLVAKEDPGRLRKCRNPECVLYFYDTSKGGQRAWCSLQQCGNKMRMAAMRERRAH